ncbi:mitochondrial carrier protein [Angomonas deanei]|uniref:Uncharacterized protein n=1 Tax=Angomonas deanei TaxID=59799 RepID=A0A7G2BZ27_9TRYP|nr:mitochondrial carrier protein [Angomonas deanei]CAD2212799.1 hypothetical protein, conserved [Angomonas deanei]|eukprot:EPY42149.1 mitochondrial carrier protein [Angomonas deanei]
MHSFCMFCYTYPLFLLVLLLASLDRVHQLDKVFGHRVGKDQLRGGGYNLWREALEEGGDPLLPEHRGGGEDSILALPLRRLLHTGLDDIHRVGNGNRAARTNGGGAGVLEEGGAAVILEAKDVVLGEGGTTEEAEGAGGVTAHGHQRTRVHAGDTLGAEEVEESLAHRRLVGLAKHFQTVEGQQKHLTEADEATSGGVDQHLIRRPEGGGKAGAVVGVEVITDEGLTRKLVDTLEHLVDHGVEGAGVEVDDLAEEAVLGVLLEDDLVEVRGGLPDGATHDGALVGHEALRRGVEGVKEGNLEHTSAGGSPGVTAGETLKKALVVLCGGSHFFIRNGCFKGARDFTKNGNKDDERKKEYKVIGIQPC